MSFGTIAVDYDRLRPAPPQAAVDWLLPPICHSAVDLGAGTGLLTRALARKVVRVIAVEPDERMRAVLTARTPGVHAVQGRGEAIPLPDASQDAVLVASAWHWMDPERTVPEVARVLRDHGRFGVVWTSRDREVEWVRQLDRLRTSTRGCSPLDVDIAAQSRRSREVSLPDNAPFDHDETVSFGFTLTMTIDDLLNLLATNSRVITSRSEERAAGLIRARRALDTWFPGRAEISVPMRAVCWRADRVARPRPATS